MYIILKNLIFVCGHTPGKISRKEYVVHLFSHISMPTARSDVGWYKIYGVTDSAQKSVSDMKNI